MQTAKKTSKKKTSPKVKTVTNVIIIDASGSMYNKVGQVKDGLKSLFTDIRKDIAKDQGTIKQDTLVLDFSDPLDTHILVPLGGELDDKHADNYRTRGSTALYDAIGFAFNMVPKGRKDVFVSILTDGEENSSREYDYIKIKSLIEEKRKKGWTITFMGTSEESIKVAVNIGISVGNTMTFANTAKGVGQTMASDGFRGYTGSAGNMGYSRAAFYSNTTRSAGGSGSMDLMESDLDNLLKESKEAKEEE